MNYFCTIKIKHHEYFEPKIYYVRWGPKIIQRWQIQITTSCCNGRYRGLPSRQRNPAWFNKPQYLVSINQSQTYCTTRAPKKEHSVQMTSDNSKQTKIHSPQNNSPDTRRFRFPRHVHLAILSGPPRKHSPAILVHSANICGSQPMPSVVQSRSLSELELDTQANNWSIVILCQSTLDCYFQKQR